MKIVLVSGRSGSGKSTALNVLEDIGYYCVDNVPIALIPQLAKELMQESDYTPTDLAVGIDARNSIKQLAKFDDMLVELRRLGIEPSILFLDAHDKTLLHRFSETRRKHPLSTQTIPLAEAMALERSLLEPIAKAANLHLETTSLSIHQLRDMLRRTMQHDESSLSLLFLSFGFKQGLPVAADMVFDCRCLPNPHWIQHLRALTGRDEAVQHFLNDQTVVQQMLADIQRYLENWLPNYAASNRIYMTIALGCTGGQHRSVYCAEVLAEHFKTLYPNTLVQHRELQDQIK